MYRLIDWGVFAVLETRIREENFAVLDSFANKWSMVTNKGLARNIRILLLWDDREIALSVIKMTDQCIHCHITSVSGDYNGFVTFVYAMNAATDRGRLWDLLKQEESHITEPWLILGDFNVVLSPTEKLTEAEEVRDVGTELLELVQSCNISDLKASGSLYTWTSSHTYCKLDRALVNDYWHMQQQDSVAFF